MQQQLNDTTKTYNKDEFEIKFQKNEKLHKIVNVELQNTNNVITEVNENTRKIDSLIKQHKITTDYVKQLENTICYLESRIIALENKPIMYLHKNGWNSKIIYEHDQEIDFSQYEFYSCNNIAMVFNGMSNLTKISCNILNGNQNILQALDNYFIVIPSLIELNIYVDDEFSMYDKLKSIPNLEKITFINCQKELNIYDICTFDLIKTFSKLVSVTYLNCINYSNDKCLIGKKCIIHKLESIKKWCKEKYIVLTIMDE